jgi:diaminohydroxyphosphoribosylaminopyrimidine deaminase/5-amino-6-(5-phosphoribosylamino)uracil reductase
MAAALALARRGLGAVHPNPAVGCILVQEGGEEGRGRVVGRGWTQPSGRPHAETEALRRAGALARGAIAYVSLEPCAHHGSTPPCAGALVRAGIARAVIAAQDPDPRVSGRGIAVLREGGIAVTTGVLEREAADLNAGFFLRVKEGRPLVTWKVASTLDGRTATHAGESKWITGETARDFAHGLRASHDAVMVGAGTVLSDDPLLTCRLPGLSARSPLRVVVDGRLRMPLTSQLVVTARDHPTWLVTLHGSDGARRRAFAECGLEIIEVGEDEEGNLDVRGLLRALGGRGITRVLLEGGGQLVGAFLRYDLIDRIAWFRAPRLMGGDGLAAAAPFGVDHLARTPTFERLDMGPAGTDIVEFYARARRV